MWCVRQIFVPSREVSYSPIFSDYKVALSFARFRRSSLNRHWLVQVCSLSVLPAHLVEK